MSKQNFERLQILLAEVAQAILLACIFGTLSTNALAQDVSSPVTVDKPAETRTPVTPPSSGCTACATSTRN